METTTKFPTPGEILKSEFMEPHNLSINGLARMINVGPMRISEIVNGKRAITTETARRLGAFFGGGPEFWLNLQSYFDLRKSKEADQGAIEKEIKTISSKELIA
ncbi:MAG: HigA family addiction module antitoxin [Deltaproteobacteria bacterium]|nr:HigA family addiction module antitoxin [Deltaproteobacteria bacterium]